MMQQKGKLIVIEGVDGSGKQTQTEKLYTRLDQEGQSVMMISYPRYHKDSSAMIRHYLAGDFGKEPSSVDAYIASTFYAADRYASYKEDYEDFYNQGGIVLADRYTTANMVHQAGKIDDPKEREQFLEWLYNYEFNLLALPKPDLVFFLNIPPQESAKLMEYRANKITGEAKKDIHESHPEYLKQAYQNALELVTKYGWQEILCVNKEGLRSIESIHEEIYQKVMDQLS